MVIAAQWIVSVVVTQFDEAQSYKILNYFIQIGCIFGLSFAGYLIIKFQGQKEKFMALWPYVTVMFIAMSTFTIYLNFFNFFEFKNNYPAQMFCVILSDIFLFVWFQADTTVT